jgi:valyl-tRNA synthetase
LNLEGVAGGPIAPGPGEWADRPLEDRWLASRLASVAREATAAMDGYRFAEAARILYGFAWDEYCSAYLELCKARLADPATRPGAQATLLLGLDTILRLLHPIMPFVTEEIWQHLREAAGGRRLPWDDGPSSESIMVASWPTPPAAWRDAETEARFGSFLGVIGGVREIRARQSVPPRQTVEVAIRCPVELAGLLEPMRPAIESMAVCGITGLGPEATAAAGAAETSAAGCDLFIDLADLIDVDAEIDRISRELAKLEGLIKGKRGKLANEQFTSRAPAAVVEKERAQLAEFEAAAEKQTAALAALEQRQA